MIYVVATVTIHPDKQSAFIKGARDVIAATNQEEGCLFYDMHQSVTDPTVFVFVERWTSRDALGGHFKAAHLKTWREISGACVSKPSVVEIITPARVETV